MLKMSRVLGREDGEQLQSYLDQDKVIMGDKMIQKIRRIAEVTRPPKRSKSKGSKSGRPEDGSGGGGDGGAAGRSGAEDEQGANDETGPDGKIEIHELDRSGIHEFWRLWELMVERTSN